MSYHLSYLLRLRTSLLTLAVFMALVLFLGGCACLAPERTELPTDYSTSPDLDAEQ